MKAPRCRLFPALCALLLGALLVACADEAVAPTDEPITPPSGTESVGIIVDEIVITGRFFGSQNDTAVILSHMRPNDQTAWFAFAEELERNGYAALTFNFRGYSGSQGDQDFGKLDEDLRAVIRYARDRGKERVFLVGASMGATTSLVVAREERVDGVVALSPPAEFDSQNALQVVPGLTVPKLFIASEEDAPALSFDELVDAAAGPKEIERYPGNAHGTDLLEQTKNAQAAAVRERILQFLEEQGGP